MINAIEGYAINHQVRANQLFTAKKLKTVLELKLNGVC